MDKTFVYSYLEQNKTSFFPNKKYSEEQIEGIMLNTSDEAANYLNGLKLSSATVAQVVSIFLGLIGIDRFYIGDILKGLLKLVTYGGFGIWWIIDIIKIKNACCVKNCEKLIELMKKYPLYSHNAQKNISGQTVITDDSLNDDISDILGEEL